MDDEEVKFVFGPRKQGRQYYHAANDDHVVKTIRFTEDYHLRKTVYQRRLLMTVTPLLELLECSLIEAQSIIEVFVRSNGRIETHTGELWDARDAVKVRPEDLAALMQKISVGQTVGLDKESMHQLRVLDLTVRLHWPMIVAHFKR